MPQFKKMINDHQNWDQASLSEKQGKNVGFDSCDRPSNLT